MITCYSTLSILKHTEMTNKIFENKQNNELGKLNGFEEN